MSARLRKSTSTGYRLAITPHFTADPDPVGGGGGGGTGSGGPSGGPSGGSPAPPASGDGAFDWDAEHTSEEWKAQASRQRQFGRTHEDRSKDSLKKATEAERELEKLRRASLTEGEQKAAEAYDRGKAETRAALGGRMVAAEIRSAAAGRVSADVLDAHLEALDPTRFLDESHEVDTARVRAWVDRVAPTGGTPHSNGGRQGPPARGMGGAGTSPRPSGREAGLSEAQRRYGAPAAH